MLHYDKLFEELLKMEGTTYTNLLIKTGYIARRVISRNFLDEDGNKIDNKYCYFEKSIKFNITKERETPTELFSDEMMEEFLKDFEDGENIHDGLFAEKDIKDLLEDHERR